MKIKILALLLLTVFAACAAETTAQKNRKPRQKKTMEKPLEAPETAKQNANLRILATTEQSNLDEPFVFVARDAETYAALQKLVENLPAAKMIDFNTTVVVAAFAGTKPTPGFSIVFTPGLNAVKIDLTAPKKDRILAQVLTAPATVVALPIAEEQSLKLDLGANWASKMTSYTVTSGKFVMSGGFAGMQKSFQLAGKINVLRSGDFVTAIFDVNAAGAESKRRMFDAASGTISNNKIALPRVEVGNLVDSPRPPVAASGEFGDARLTLEFEPLPTNVADGFQGRGALEAKR